jgi:hypothetical protein
MPVLGHATWHLYRKVVRRGSKGCSGWLHSSSWLGATWAQNRGWKSEVAEAVNRRCGDAVHNLVM